MLLDTIKSAIGITSTVFDREIEGNIETALADMDYTTDINYLEINDPLITKAVTTFCAYQHHLLHGNADLSDKLKKSYVEQKKALLMSGKYSFGG